MHINNNNILNATHKNMFSSTQYNNTAQNKLTTNPKQQHTNTPCTNITNATQRNVTYSMTPDTGLQFKYSNYDGNFSYDRNNAKTYPLL